jgi:hypothetical protein
MQGKAGLGNGEKATVDGDERATGPPRKQVDRARDWMDWAREGRLDRRGSEDCTVRGREG